MTLCCFLGIERHSAQEPRCGSADYFCRDCHIVPQDHGAEFCVCTSQIINGSLMPRLIMMQ